jgi:tetratricopeptide (TPR) repeat protein
MVLLVCSPAYLNSAYAYWKDESIKDYSRIADIKQKKAQEKVGLINGYYNKGRSHYQSRQYAQARSYFEQILEIEPSYEPARLFMESIAIQENILEARRRIEHIKMEMADIMAEYDKRVQRTDMLAVKYFLELAQKECQIGNFAATEQYYTLCYKIHPYNKDNIEWFVEATYDLMILYDKLDKENTEMEEIIDSLR